MNNYRIHPLSITTLCGLFLMTGCGSDGGGGNPAIPANAITIDSSIKAEITTMDAASAGQAIIFIFGSGSGSSGGSVLESSFNSNAVIASGIETSTSPAAKDIISMIFKKFSDDRPQQAPAVTGATFNESCDVSGSISGDFDQTSTSGKGNIDYNACDDGDGAVLTGSVTLNVTFPAFDADGPYTNQASGNLSIV